LAPGGEDLAPVERIWREGEIAAGESALGEIAARGRKQARRTGSRKKEKGPQTASVIDKFGA